MTLNMKKDDFLLNKINKQRFLELLTHEINCGNLNSKQASGDADLEIVLTALKISEEQPTVIIGEDTDLLCLLLHHANDKHHIYFTSEQKSNVKQKPKLWDIGYVRSKLGNEASKIILLVHALLGCDTTSRIFGVNKAVAFTKLMSDKMFCTYADVFTRLSSHHNDIIDAR